MSTASLDDARFKTVFKMKYATHIRKQIISLKKERAWTVNTCRVTGVSRSIEKRYWKVYKNKK